MGPPASSDRGILPPVVRQPLRKRDVRRRTLGERIGLRLPWLTAVFGRTLTRLPPGSRVRRAGMARIVEQGTAAYNRRDLEAVVIGFHPDVEYYPYREFVEAGLAEPSYHGRDGYREYIGQASEVWGAGVQLEPTELIDLGDRLVVLADMPMQAQLSGVALAETYASVWTLRDGLIVRIEDYLDQSQALRAVGLD